MAVERGAHVIRTHDVAETRDAALVGREFTRDRLAGADIEELDVTCVPEAERHLERLGGDQDVAAGAIARAFEIRGLDAQTRDRLVELGRELDVVVSGDDPVFLAGTVASIRRLENRLVAGEPEVGPVADRLTALR